MVRAEPRRRLDGLTHRRARYPDILQCDYRRVYTPAVLIDRALDQVLHQTGSFVDYCEYHGERVGCNLRGRASRPHVRFRNQQPRPLSIPQPRRQTRHLPRNSTRTNKFITKPEESPSSLTWQQTDTQIPARGTRDYYDRVKARDANVADYYRLFLAPGVNHCFGGRGPWPDTAFDAMREWVEDDVAPETLLATTVGVAPEVQRPLCPYPKKQTYKGHGDPNLASSFVCV